MPVWWQFIQYRCTSGHCAFGGVEVQIGKDTEPPLVFSVPSSIRKEKAGFLLWDTGAQRGWEALDWGRIACAGAQVTIHSALGCDGGINSMVLSLSKLWEMVKGREAWHAACSPWGQRFTHDWGTEHNHHHHLEREHKHSNQLATTCGYLRCAGWGTWMKCMV